MAVIQRHEERRFVLQMKKLGSQERGWLPADFQKGWEQLPGALDPGKGDRGSTLHFQGCRRPCVVALAPSTPAVAAVLVPTGLLGAPWPQV